MLSLTIFAVAASAAAQPAPAASAAATEPPTAERPGSDAGAAAGTSRDPARSGNGLPML